MDRTQPSPPKTEKNLDPTRPMGQPQLTDNSGPPAWSSIHHKQACYSGTLLEIQTLQGASEIPVLFKYRRIFLNVRRT